LGPGLWQPANREAGGVAPSRQVPLPAAGDEKTPGGNRPGWPKARAPACAASV